MKIFILFLSSNVSVWYYHWIEIKWVVRVTNIQYHYGLSFILFHNHQSICYIIYNFILYNHFLWGATSCLKTNLMIHLILKLVETRQGCFWSLWRIIRITLKLSRSPCEIMSPFKKDTDTDFDMPIRRQQMISHLV